MAGHSRPSGRSAGRRTPAPSRTSAPAKGGSAPTPALLTKNETMKGPPARATQTTPATQVFYKNGWRP